MLRRAICVKLPLVSAQNNQVNVYLYFLGHQSPKPWQKILCGRGGSKLRQVRRVSEVLSEVK